MGCSRADAIPKLNNVAGIPNKVKYFICLTTVFFIFLLMVLMIQLILLISVDHLL